MKLGFYHNERKKSINLSKINIFYGYSSSGKTTFSNALFLGLQGKDKSFTINNMSITKDEKDVILINSKESIIDHLKLSSKSYLKKLYYETIKSYLDDHGHIIENINNQFQEINNILSNYSQQFNQKTSLAKISLSLDVLDNESIIDNFINVTFDYETLSTSASKELLFTLIMLLQNSDKEMHVIIDDFDSNLDEQATINFIKEISKMNVFFYLFTCKPNSIIYTIGKCGIINIRENDILDFSNILFLIKKSMEDSFIPENQTYEEYIINFGYFENSGQFENLLKEIKINSVYNLGRMFTSKTYFVTDTVDYDNISIIPSSEKERIFLEYIDSLINNN